MAPIVDGLKAQYEGVVEFRLLNIEQDPAGAKLAGEFGVPGVPAFIFLNSDGSRNNVIFGAVPEADLMAELDALK